MSSPFPAILSLGVVAIIAQTSVNSSPTDSHYNFKEKIVHLDLKGAPLAISYMEKVFPLLRKMGATGLLIEYEDMFPYSGSLRNLTALNHYSVENINRLLAAAQSNNLTTMPLIQTFGHLEFSLKLEEHIELRENSTNPQALCPSLNESMQMIREMIRQVVDLHKGYITHLHIGSDEVFVIGQCSRCKARMVLRKWTTDDLFLDHVFEVASAVKELGIQPVMWDDMLRKVDMSKLSQYKNLSSLVEIMVWQYSQILSPDVLLAMEKYIALNFPGIWVASAFKGATDPTYQLPDYTTRLGNNIAWVLMARIFEDRLNIKGIVLTGWQRFDHFTALCQLFASSVPVLSLCLAYLNTGSYDTKVLGDIQKLLRCNHPIALDDFPQPLLACDYPGSKVLIAIQQYNQIRQKRLLTEAKNTYKATMTAMNRNHNFSSPSTLRSAISEIMAMQQLVKTVQENLNELASITDEATLREWTDTYLSPEIAWINEVQRAADNMLCRNAWPRRPLYNDTH
ncbi:hexosaminidase D-like [Varroa jacobsoni]|uniref:hexosaminidase D-like n=1 Tax=Varroa jacobsoni TaxID=62625 RepID=UPI000BF7B579|nr:hexosaminidase D-like [Varroa jacobsoni]